MKKYLIYPLIEIFIYKGDNTMEQIDRVKQWRKENPEMYESYADMGLNEWITMKIIVKGNQAKLYLNNNQQLCS